MVGRVSPGAAAPGGGAATQGPRAIQEAEAPGLYGKVWVRSVRKGPAQDYEACVARPVQSAVFGDMARLLLIQMQVRFVGGESVGHYRRWWLMCLGRGG